MIKKVVPVLMYHRINHPNRESSLIVSPPVFSRQLEWLQKKRFHFLTLDEVIDSGAEAPLFSRQIALTFDDGFRDNDEHALRLLIQREIPAALFVVVNWVGQSEFLSWQEIREMADSGITIGSHSLTHRWLPDITDEKELRSEICDSKQIIEERLEREVKHFSYPVGGVDQRVADLVKEAGYQAAWVASARPTVRVSNPRYSLRRVKIGNKDSNLCRFAIRAYGVRRIVLK